jgi:hypothetical protein
MDNIINPLTNEVFSIFSKEGKYLLKQFVKIYQSGGRLSEKCEDVNKNLKEGQEMNCMDTKEKTTECFKKLALKHHPDKGGKKAHFQKLNEWRESCNIKDVNDAESFIDNKRRKMMKHISTILNCYLMIRNVESLTHLISTHISLQLNNANKEELSVSRDMVFSKLMIMHKLVRNYNKLNKTPDASDKTDIRKVALKLFLITPMVLSRFNENDLLNSLSDLKKILDKIEDPKFLSHQKKKEGQQQKGGSRKGGSRKGSKSNSTMGILKSLLTTFGLIFAPPVIAVDEITGKDTSLMSRESFIGAVSDTVVGKIWDLIDQDANNLQAAVDTVTTQGLTEIRPTRMKTGERSVIDGISEFFYGKSHSQELEAAFLRQVGPLLGSAGIHPQDITINLEEGKTAVRELTLHDLEVYKSQTHISTTKLQNDVYTNHESHKEMLRAQIKSTLKGLANIKFDEYIEEELRRDTDADTQKRFRTSRLTYAKT